MARIILELGFFLTEPVFLKNAWSVYLYSIEAGIGEEAARYINLILLLVLFKNKKWQINGAILGSAILFALPHIGNAFASELKQDRKSVV